MALGKLRGSRAAAFMGGTLAILATTAMMVAPAGGSTSKPATSNTTAPNCQGSTPLGMSGSWNCSFDDEFNGTSLNTEPLDAAAHGEQLLHGRGRLLRQQPEHDLGVRRQPEPVCREGAVGHTMRRHVLRTAVRRRHGHDALPVHAGVRRLRGQRQAPCRPPSRGSRRRSGSTRRTSRTACGRRRARSTSPSSTAGTPATSSRTSTTTTRPATPTRTTCATSASRSSTLRAAVDAHHADHLRERHRPASPTPGSTARRRSTSRSSSP